MNGQPHTHKVQIEKEYYNREGPWEVTYGDTKVYVNRFLGRLCSFHTPKASRRKVERAIRKAIARHDRGSQEAEQRMAKVRQTKELFNNIVASYPGEETVEQWPSEQRRGKNATSS